jgi:glycosyltransferase involved in cell wall biosynthesis
MELTILMPCLNEAETVETCVRKAVGFLQESGIEGEVVVADNGSTDGSQKLASDAGARVVPIKEKGYGNALIGGITAAHGKYVIMGDADDSYDFTNLMPFVEELRNGHELVMGNRFKGGIEPGAMPKLHKYLGNPVLSFVGRLFFPSAIGDFHCGLRGFNRESALQLNHRHGVRQRDGGQGHPLGAEGHGSADDLEEGRPVPAAAPALMARRLAAPAVPAALQPALAVLAPWCAAVPARPDSRSGRRGGTGHHRQRDL